ncbi:hypothetical protein CL622_07300 [archaeon]|nr:hypothetical protein [archaeon]
MSDPEQLEYRIGESTLRKVHRAYIITREKTQSGVVEFEDVRGSNLSDVADDLIMALGVIDRQGIQFEAVSDTYSGSMKIFDTIEMKGSRSFYNLETKESTIHITPIEETIEEYTTNQILEAYIHNISKDL